MEENIFDKLKNVVHKPKPEPTKPKATKISDINSKKIPVVSLPFYGLL